MIYTITFNPSIDYIVKVNEFKLGEINIGEMCNKYPGGKGINVSRVLNNLKVKSIALGFVGGFTGAYIKQFLEGEGVQTDFIKIKEDTRINIKLKSSEETEINGAGPYIGEEDLEELFKKLDKLTSNDFVVLAGNVQKSIPRDIYMRIQERCLNKDVKFVVDATGEALICTLKYKPFLIKPNTYELGEMFNVHINNKEEVLYYGTKLLEKGAQNVIVSMAGDGALLICNQGIYHACAPKGIVKNSVGAGDSLIGGLLAQYSTGFNILEAFKWGAAAGSATAFSIDLCSRSSVEALIEQVVIDKLS